MARNKPEFNDSEALRREIAAWEQQRNQQKAQMEWRFASKDVRVKLQRLYASINPS